MSSNSYYNYNDTDNWKIIEGYNKTIDYGWNGDGLRGYFYISKTLPIGILSFKGTSIYGETRKKDKYMDNMMFSCCCAKVNDRWNEICNCFDGKICSNKCVSDFVNYSKISYRDDANIIYKHIKTIYPQYEIWTTGHSLGGVIASILALENNLFAMVYSTPGDKLFAYRCGINLSSKLIYHYGSNSDPIFNGNCNGLTSTCNLIGYALETKCHTGYVCVYNSTSYETILEHKIDTLINKYIINNNLPTCYEQKECNECESWTFI